MRFAITSGILLSLLMLSACQPSAQTPTAAFVVEDAWVRAMPPGQKMTAAYGVFRNSGSVSLRISEFSSPQYASVSLHETIVDSSGMSKMQEIQEMLIPPGEVFELEPGGKHLMLMGKYNNQTEEETDSVSIIFSLEKPHNIEFRLK
ncbi:MAG: copper chaperone PCu(A)C [Xanthomonadales bacterium]|nr:copper chaperone PCu(A)C [Xanthomonadales bacterium]